MDFINKIYNSEYFVIGLFVLIALLVILLLFLIFSGRKKDKKEEQVSKVENNSLNTENQTDNNNANDNVQVTDNQELKQENTVNNIVDLSTPDANTTNTISSSEDMSKMTFGQPSQLDIDNPTTIDVTPINEEPQPIESLNQNTDDLYNTNIFHDMPLDLNNATENMSTQNMPNMQVEPEISQPIALENQATPNMDNQNVTADLFQPVPDLGTVDISVPVNNPITATDSSTMAQPIVQENTAPINNDIVMPIPKTVEQPITMPEAVENTVQPVDNLMSQPVETVQVEIPKPKIPSSEQFSSVFVNKETPKVSPTIPNEVQGSQEVKPAYDPTLFQSSINISNSNVTTPSPSAPIQSPIVDNITAEIPALEPLPDISNEVESTSTPNVSAQPTSNLDFSLPKLVDEVNNTNMNTTATNFTNISGETYDIK